MNTFVAYFSVMIGGLVSGIFLFNSEYCKTLSLNDKLTFTFISSAIAFTVVFLVLKKLKNRKNEGEGLKGNLPPPPPNGDTPP